MQKIMDGNEACAYSSYGFTEVAGIYPITPSSPMAELVDKYASSETKNFFDMPFWIMYTYIILYRRLFSCKKMKSAFHNFRKRLIIEKNARLWYNIGKFYRILKTQCFPVFPNPL